LEKLERVAGDASFHAFFEDFDVDDHVISLNNASDASSRAPVLHRFQPSAPTKPTQLFLEEFWCKGVRHNMLKQWLFNVAGVEWHRSH
jgi:hypothetical protein